MARMTGVSNPPSAADTMAPSEGGATMDLHGVVLTQAFDSLLLSNSRVLVVTSDKRQLSLSHPILLLFSPLLRSALASVRDSMVPTIVLPEVSSTTLMQLEDLLTSGKSTFPSLADCRAVLEASSLLGIPISSLATGDQGPALKINLGRQPELEASLFHAERRRRKVVLVSEDLGARGEQSTQHQPMETGATNKGRELRKASSQPAPNPAPQKSVQPVQVKQEPVAEEEVNTSGKQALPGESQGSTFNQHVEAEASLGLNSAEAKNKCEKCYKGFPSLTLLRYHYCSHFRGLLKKKYAELFEDNKCLICQKTFANSGRLLLHIGVQHDKINEILKSKGLRVLPPFMTTVSTPDSAVVSKTEPMESETTKDEPSMLDIPTNTTKTTIKPAVEPAPMIIHSRTTISPIITPTSTFSTPAVPTNPTPPAGPPTSRPASPAPPSAPPQENSQQDSTSCNYDLECEVCSQKQRSIQLLEQHCCRHFMKELQEQYDALMDGLKCTLCNNVFKQKHSLLLHIGCKHGKVNDILKQKGFAALPCPVNATNNAAMQKQLIQIKKERMETVKDEGVEQKGNSTLDAILKKYKFTTGAGNKLKKV